MVYADKADYGKTNSWYIYDTNRDWENKWWWIENKKWYTEKGIETKTNKWWTRFCFASIEKLNSIGIIDIRGI